MDLLGKRRVIFLSLASDRDGVEDKRDRAGQHGSIVGRWVPRKDLWGHCFLKERLYIFYSLNGVLRVNRNIPSSVLLMRAERVHDGPHCHCRIQLLSQTNADRNVMFLFDLAAAIENFIP